MGFTTTTHFLNESNESVFCHNVSLMAFETKVPSVSFSPKRGKVEKNVSSTLFISSLASSVWFATRTTIGVSFSGVNTTWMTNVIAAATSSTNESNVIAIILIVFFTCVFIPLCFWLEQKYDKSGNNKIKKATTFSIIA